MFRRAYDEVTRAHVSGLVDLIFFHFIFFIDD